MHNQHKGEVASGRPRIAFYPYFLFHNKEQALKTFTITVAMGARPSLLMKRCFLWLFLSEILVGHTPRAFAVPQQTALVYVNKHVYHGQ